MLQLSGRSRQFIEHSQKTPLASNPIPIWCYYQARRKEYNYSLVAQQLNNWEMTTTTPGQTQTPSPDAWVCRMLLCQKNIRSSRIDCLFIINRSPLRATRTSTLSLYTHVPHHPGLLLWIVCFWRINRSDCVLGEQVNIDTHEDRQIDKPTGPSHLLLVFPLLSQIIIWPAAPLYCWTSSISTADRST